MVRKEVAPIRVDLEGDLEGHNILVNPQALTMGLLEDIQSGQTTAMLDAIAATLVGGDLPDGHDRKALRAMTPAEFADLCTGVAGCVSLKKKN